LRLILILLLAFPITSLPAQKKCYKCKGHGFIQCKSKDHDSKRLCGKWKFEHRCTSLWAAPCCRGLHKQWCQRCNDPIVEAELATEQQDRIAWVKSHREYLKRAGLKGTTIETKNFRLHVPMRRWSGKGARYTRSKAAHLFAFRLQRLADRFSEICGTLPTGLQTLVMCDNEAENVSFTLHHMGGGHRSPFRLNSLTGLVCTWPIPTNPWALKDDQNMHSHVVHMGTHLLHWSAIKFHMRTVVWFDVGLAHWFELDQTKQTRQYCINEGSGKDPWRMADWKKKIYGELSKKEEVKFATLLTRKNLDQTNAREHAYCWSFVDYLITRDAAKFKKLYDEMKTQNDSKKAIDKIYNTSTASLHDQWRKWALKAYSPK